MNKLLLHITDALADTIVSGINLNFQKDQYILNVAIFLSLENGLPGDLIFMPLIVEPNNPVIPRSIQEIITTKPIAAYALIIESFGVRGTKEECEQITEGGLASAKEVLDEVVFFLNSPIFQGVFAAEITHDYKDIIPREEGWVPKKTLGTFKRMDLNKVSLPPGHEFYLKNYFNECGITADTLKPFLGL